MKKATKKDIIKGYSDFLGKEFTEAPKKVQEDYIKRYRAVENENIKAIRKCGSVEAWYRSGEDKAFKI
jgi:hypothetical protein